MFSDAKEDDKLKIPPKVLSRKKYSKVKLKKKNAASIKNEICHQITQMLNQHAQDPCGALKHPSLTYCSKIARCIGILETVKPNRLH